VHILQVLQRVTHGDYYFPASIPVSDSCKDLLRKILVVKPEERITVEGIQEHPW
jgi:serine/threonine protein kinase